MPGTWGSLAAVSLALVLSLLSPPGDVLWLWLLFVLSLFLGVPAASVTARELGETDPSQIVIDEVSGQILACLWVYPSTVDLVAAFFLFRLFDILKPFPARRAEKLPGGWGILLDDLIAGGYAAAALQVIAYVSGR